MKYRQDIDGLRAIAIIAVLMFHLEVPGFSGGYAGVDVFFVISGYLISRWIGDRMLAGDFTFSHFYIRRLRRLMPSFLATLFCVMAVGYLLSGPEDLLSLGRTSATALVFSSNWYFLTLQGYFEPALETNPMLHTWSLGIEEQFYLLWPLMLFASKKDLLDRSRRFKSLLLALFASSLLLSVFLSLESSSQQSFFNSAGRIWELMLGAGAGLGIVRAPARAKGLRLLSLACLAAVFVFYTKKLAYPGLAATLPTFATFLLLLVEPGRKDVTGQFLVAPPVRFFGKISYSLYLWHWPILVYFKTIIPELSWHHKVAIVIASLMLATATTYALENPIRQRRIIKSDRTFLMVIGALFAILAGFIVEIVSSNGMPERFMGMSQ